jgi:hypothetical protein
MVNMPSADHVPCQRAILAMHALGSTMTVVTPISFTVPAMKKTAKDWPTGVVKDS